MDKIFIGIDVHQKQSFYCALNKSGRCLGHDRMCTDRELLKKLVERYLDMGEVEVAIEAGGSTWWISEVLRKSGAKVYVVNTHELKLIAHSKKKTDKYDSKVLADLLRCGGLPEAVYVPEVEILRLRSMLRVRKWVVKQRSQAITRAKALMRHVGIVVTPRMFHTIKSWEEVIGRHHEWKELIRPMYRAWATFNEEYKRVEAALEDLLPVSEERMSLLTTIPGVGSVTSRTLIASVGDIGRFWRSAQLVSYCGLVPSESSSGDRQRTGSITKRGRSDLRDAYIQAAWAVLRSSHPGSVGLKKFFYRIMQKRCSQVAIVALAKKLLIISYYVLKQRIEFESDRYAAKAA